eukprot:COSAG04_NODE_517_length_13186_cov_7.434248_21_plen_75_part_00
MSCAVRAADLLLSTALATPLSRRCAEIYDRHFNSRAVADWPRPWLGPFKRGLREGGPPAEGAPAALNLWHSAQT